jgi:hypothetical protein
MGLSRKVSKKRYHRKQKSVKKGGRGCGKKILGGSAFFAPTYNPSAISPYMKYDLNTFGNDPSYPPSMQSGRNWVGGKKKSKRRVRWNKKLTHSMRMSKIKGGNTSLTPQHTNPISTFGTVDGAFSSASILNSSGSLLNGAGPYNNMENNGIHNPVLV